MSSYERNDENIPTDTEAYYETVASQEEIYLEEREEEVREVLDSETPVQNDTNSDRLAESLDELLADAVEELISGDADDPPLSGQMIADMLSSSAAIHVLPRIL